MKKKFEKPEIEVCEFVVAARLDVSGGGGHSNSANNSECTRNSSASSNACTIQSNPNSNSANAAC